MVPLYRGPALKPDQLYFMPCAFNRLRSSSLPLFQGWSVSLLVQTPPKHGCNPHRNPVQCCFLGGQWRTRERLRTRMRRVGGRLYKGPASRGYAGHQLRPRVGPSFSLLILKIKKRKKRNQTNKQKTHFALDLILWHFISGNMKNLGA